MPGLVDARLESRHSISRAAAGDAERDGVDPLPHSAMLCGAQLAVLEGLRAGTTTFCDAGPPFLGWAETYAAAGARACLAVDVSAGGTGHSGGGGAHAGAADAAAEADLRTAASFAAQYHGSSGGRIQCQLAPCASACTQTQLNVAARAAKAYGGGLHVAVCAPDAEVNLRNDALHAQVARPVGALDASGVLSPTLLAAHLTRCTVEEAATVAFKSGRMVICPTQAAIVDGNIGPVREFRAAGGACGLGTGAASLGCGHNLWNEARAVALAAKLDARDGSEAPATDVLRMATVEGARALGLADRVGMLDVGMQADFIVLRLDSPSLLLSRPLAHTMRSDEGVNGSRGNGEGRRSSEGGSLTPSAVIEREHARAALLARAILWNAGAESVSHVFVAGKVVKRCGSVLTMDERKVITEAQRQADRLQQWQTV